MYLPDLPLPEDFMDVKLVIQKELIPIDLCLTANRFCMPFKKLNRNDFLNENEQERLMVRTPNGKRVERIRVLFIEPNGDRNAEGIVFKKWVRPKMYVLIGQWHRVCEKHKLEVGTIVRVYSFRFKEGELGFAMAVVGKGENGNGNSKGKGTELAFARVGSGSV
ncbi:hypothetical protein Vadar_007460 [Vaccinium darrowii]|uniref:Uncharacterized protein n=1 Tax=Vaccinium darrowii TaxID=229202 RepID=A0ACB7YC60_9ERIC|nr:hypothetical protein Vadar_007460 [Vaccinium darrowii]